MGRKAKAAGSKKPGNKKRGDTAALIVLAEEHYKAGRPKKAAEALARAAEQGHALAQLYLGVMYRDGKGVPQDEAKAAEQSGTLDEVSAA